MSGDRSGDCEAIKRSIEAWKTGTKKMDRIDRINRMGDEISQAQSSDPV
jgi:hypothetical protein